MGQLYDVVQLLEHAIHDRGLDEFETKGQISLRSGILTAVITPETPDDPERLSSLQAAVEEVLGRRLPI